MSSSFNLVTFSSDVKTFNFTSPARLPNANVGIEPYMVCFSMENKYSNSDVFERELMLFDLATTLEVRQCSCTCT